MHRLLVIAMLALACGGGAEGACFRVQVEDSARVLFEFRTADGDLLGRCDLGTPVHPRRDCVGADGAPVPPEAFGRCE